MTREQVEVLQVRVWVVDWTYVMLSSLKGTDRSSRKRTRSKSHSCPDQFSFMARVLKGQLESVKEKLKAEIVIVQEQRAGLQACLNQARQDAVEQRALLDERLSRQEAASEKLLEAQRKRAEGAEDAAVQAKDHADMMKGELDDYLRTQKERQAQVELMDQELRDTRLRMQDALEKAQSAREQCELGDKERFASLDKISTLETQIVNLKEANLFLTNRSKTLQERYNNGDLVSQWTTFESIKMTKTGSDRPRKELRPSYRLRSPVCSRERPPRENE